MKYTVAQIVEAARSRGWTTRGVGLASDYVATVRSAVGGSKGMARHFAGKSAADIDALVKAASDTLVFRPDGARILSTTKKSKKKDSVVTQGTPMRKSPGEMTKDSILDFECVLTSKNKDRDGDEIDPKGAQIDTKMPLLWQHIPVEPIGKLVDLLSQDSDDVKTHLAVADTPIGHDAVVLVEFGALRISHGFRPIKYEPIEDDGGINGWRIHECEVMEASLVSIPANTDAVITAFSRRKLHAPLVKGWAEHLHDSRPVLVKGGWVPPLLKSVNAGGRGGAVSVTVNVGRGTRRKAAGKGAGKGADNDSGEEKPKDDDEPDEGKDDEPDEEGDSDKGNALLSDLADKLAEMAKDEALPGEARNRCGVVAGMLAEVGERVQGALEDIAAAAANQDIGGVGAAAAEMVRECYGKLGRAAEEMERICGVPDLPDGVAEDMRSLSEQIGVTAEALAGMDPDAGEGDVADDEGKDDDADTPDDEAEDDASDESDDDKDEDGDEDEGEEGKPDYADEDKDEDEEDEEDDDRPDPGDREADDEVSDEDDPDKDEDTVDEDHGDDLDEDEEDKGDQVEYECHDCGKRFMESGTGRIEDCPSCGSENTAPRKDDDADEKDDPVETDDDGIEDEETNDGVPDPGKAQRAAAKLLGELIAGGSPDRKTLRLLQGTIRTKLAEAPRDARRKARRPARKHRG
jgi:HK97 family phage prohead protease